MSKAELVFIGVAALVLAALFFFLYDGKKQCDAAGGVYLRGFFGYECVQMK